MKPWRGRPPTDFELLESIYELHREDYGERTKAIDLGSPTMAQQSIFLPIDIDEVADRLGVDSHIVFGRLYYHLDPQYAPPKESGKPNKHLFSARVGHEENCINFPMLQAVLAGLWQQRNRDQLALWAAVLSLGIAVASLLVAIFT